MSKWLLRGLVFAALMVFIRLVQGAAINAWETKAALISITLVVLFAIAVLIWGFIDGRSDARANPDPDRREDLAMTWLLAGLFAGIVSGAVAWLISLFYKQPVCRWADQRAHHVRGVHRAADLRHGDPRRRDRALGHRPACRRGATPAPRPGRRRRGPRGYRRVRRRASPGHTRGRGSSDRAARSGIALGLHGQVAQCQQVALNTESDDDAGGHRAQVGVVPKLLSGMHVGDVQFDQRGA